MLNNLSFKDKIPTVLTFIALFLSFLAIILLLEGLLMYSLGVLLLGFIVDMLDGFSARKLNAASQYGRSLDSSVDIILHLLYPILVFYLGFNFNSLFSILILFFFLASGIYRLVQFNTVGFSEAGNNLNYEGLPVFVGPFLVLILFLISYFCPSIVYITGILFICISAILMNLDFSFPKPQLIWPIILIILLVSTLMFYLGYNGINWL